MRKAKTHLTLLGWIFLMLAGSAVFLHTTLHGDLTGHPPRTALPLWKQPLNPQVVDDFQIDVEFDQCEFKERATDKTAPLEDQYACGLSDAMVPVTATISGANENMGGLYLVLLSSKDFYSWWQANEILLPRELFALNSSSLSSAKRDELSRIFYETAATYDRDEYGAKTATSARIPIDPARVPVTELAPKLMAQFTGAGATPMTTSLVTTELSTAAAPDGCLGPPPCAANFDEFIAAWYSLSAKYVTEKTVKTKMCLGAPGFNFVVGCITASLPKKEVYETKCTWGGVGLSGASDACKGYSGPPFYGCRAINTQCGSSCNTEARRRPLRCPRSTLRASRPRSRPHRAARSAQAQEPANRYATSPHTFCTDGKIKQREIEEAYLRGLRLEPGAVFFAVMYVLGLGAMFMMYVTCRTLLLVSQRCLSLG
jgi:hypothetical protein